ncbi:MAG: MCE family protein [Streptosporangiaceae bacterium]|nr:MCE family protein [Streptosporangiaceae bacterium]
MVAALITVCFLLAAGITGAVLTFGGPGTNQYTAYFSEAVGVYPGSGVDVLGVRVGTIDSVQPAGRYVRVVMSVNSGVPVPAAADAVVIVPSVIADRYIQLSPPYTGGPRLAGNATIPASRTATPVEIDQLYGALTKFAQDLGPNGVNAHGALSDTLNVGAKNLSGNGAALGTMIRNLSQLYQTLQGSEGNFFGTIGNLEQFTAMLKASDGQVRAVQNQLASVSAFLAAMRQQLAAALNELATALNQVQAFIANNRSALTTNITRLEAITQILVNQRASLAQALRALPLAADNLLNAYDPANGMLVGRGDLNELSMGRCSYLTNPSQRGCPAGSGGAAPGGAPAGGAPAPLPLPANGAASAVAPGSGGAP